MMSSIKFEMRSSGASGNRPALQSKKSDDGVRSRKLWSLPW